MRASTLCLALGAAQLATCTPTPRQSMALVADAPDAAHARGVATTSRDGPSRLDRNRGAPAQDRSEPAASPWQQQRPPRPLAKHRIPPVQGQGQGPPQIEIIRVRPAAPNVDDEDDAEVLDVTYATPPYPGIPCPHSRPSRERNDMLVVFLAIAFMMAVVVMETWGSIFKRRGAIRLEHSRHQSPVSIQATPASEKDRDGGGMRRV